MRKSFINHSLITHGSGQFSRPISLRCCIYPKVESTFNLKSPVFIDYLFRVSKMVSEWEPYFY